MQQYPKNQLELWRRCAEPLIEVIERYRTTGKPSAHLLQCVAMLCRNEPDARAEWLRSRLHVHTVPLTPATAHDTLEVMQQLSRRLAETPGQCIFLLNDAKPLADMYEQLSGRPAIRLLLNRQLLSADESLYPRLMSLLNEAVLTAGVNWPHFLAVYQEKFHELLANKTVGATLRKVLTQSTSSFASRVNAHQPIQIVDTGMQGTFALAVWASLRDVLELEKTQATIQLLGVYPWLSEIFRGHCVTTDPRLVLRAEILSKEVANVAND